MSSTQKIKVLLVGRVDSVAAARAITAKIAALHAHRTAGPFDVAFSTCHSFEALEYWMNLQQAQALVIPLYLQDTNATTRAALQLQTNRKKDSLLQEEGSVGNGSTGNSVSVSVSVSVSGFTDATMPTVTTTTTEIPTLLAPNLYVLRNENATNATTATVVGTSAGTSAGTVGTVTPTDTDNTDDPQSGIWRLSLSSSSSESLVVASLAPQFRSTLNHPLTETVRHVSYTGCDILLSTEWPQGIETLVPLSGLTSKAGTLTKTHTRMLSFDVADIAAHAKARYHVAFIDTLNDTAFVQTPAFSHIGSITTTTTNPTHSGRFLSLCVVQTSKNDDNEIDKQTTIVNDKASKCIHAIGIVPLHSQAAVESEGSVALAACPYTDVSYSMENATSGTSRHTQNSTSGLSQAAARRILVEDRQIAVSHQSTNSAFRWNLPSHHQSKRGRNDGDDETIDQTHNKTLFVYGLHKDVSGRLQQCHETHDSLLFNTFRPMGAKAIRKPPSSNGTSSTTSFCFVDFGSHEQARHCLETTGGEMTVEGVMLQLKWATMAGPNTNTSGATNMPSTAPSKRARLTEREAGDSSVVYFKYALESSKITIHEGTTTTTSLPAIGEELRQWMEHTLEVALLDNDNALTEPVKAAMEPALQVQLRLPSDTEVSTIGTTLEGRSNSATTKRFGFLDFASHAAASMAMAILTGSTDGGRVLTDQQEARAKQLKDTATSTTMPSAALSPQIGLYLNWGTASSKHEKGTAGHIIEDGSSQFKFERKHFPADARKDCWFCLASPACEKHLITGVYHTCYATLPKGPVHPGHILLVPVQHGSRGAWTDTVLSSEMEDLKQTMRRHASSAYDADLFVFERAIQTKGGYHTHVQCIPVDRRRGFAIQATMLAQAKKLGLELREINSDVGIRAVLGNDDNDCINDNGYFYAEVPMGMEYKRFLYQVKDNTLSSMNASPRVPLQFGREILAAVLGDPSIAHWKSCLVDADQEASMAVAFRESLAKFSV